MCWRSQLLLLKGRWKGAQTVCNGSWKWGWNTLTSEVASWPLGRTAGRWLSFFSPGNRLELHRWSFLSQQKGAPLSLLPSAFWCRKRSHVALLLLSRLVPYLWEVRWAAGMPLEGPSTDTPITSLSCVFCSWFTSFCFCKVHHLNYLLTAMRIYTQKAIYGREGGDPLLLHVCWFSSDDFDLVLTADNFMETKEKAACHRCNSCSWNICRLLCHIAFLEHSL